MPTTRKTFREGASVSTTARRSYVRAIQHTVACMGYSDLNHKRAYQRDWYRRNKHFWRRRRERQRAEIKQFIDRAKQRPCEDCGGCFPPVCLDFHHRDAKQKLFEIGAAARMLYPLNRVEQEIAKCDLICSNCHRIRSYAPQLRTA